MCFCDKTICTQDIIFITAHPFPSYSPLVRRNLVCYALLLHPFHSIIPYLSLAVLPVGIRTNGDQTTMVSDMPAAASSNMAFQRPSNSDEIMMLQRVQFSDCLKDLKNLRQQLYSAAEYFESSYHKNDHKQVVIESSKDYVAEALVSAVDHMGSMADKLSKFLDEKVGEIASTGTRFSSVERRLHMFRGFVDLRGVAQHSLIPNAPQHHKHYSSQDREDFHFATPKIMVYKNCVSCPQYDMMNRSKQDNPFSQAFQGALMKPQLQLLRKGGLRSFSRDSSPNRAKFSFTRVLSSKETGKRVDSPPQFLLKRSGSAAHRSVSPSNGISKQQVQWPVPEAARGTRIPGFLRPGEAASREGQIMSYSRRSKNLFKALLSIHHSRKEMAIARSS